jgi:hypothetical protein
MSILKQGKNHLGEPVLKVYAPKCPLCGGYMMYSEFLFDIQRELNSETDKLIRIQQIEAMIEKVREGGRVEFIGVLFGCPEHYLKIPKAKQDKMRKKPYMTMDAEDVWHMSNTRISHIYVTTPIN